MGEDFVVDNSVVMGWCFDDESSRYADAVLGRLENCTGFVPSIWPLEVCNVLLVAERKNRITEAGSTHFITLLAELPIIVEPEPPERMLREIFVFARYHNLSSYDVSYLYLAMRKGLPLATLDKKLMIAAERSNVPLLGEK